MSLIRETCPRSVTKPRQNGACDLCPAASWMFLHYIGPNFTVLKAFYIVHQYYLTIYFLTAFPPSNDVTTTDYFQFAFKKFYKVSSGHFRSPYHHTRDHFAMALSRGVVTASLTDASLYAHWNVARGCKTSITLVLVNISQTHMTKNFCDLNLNTIRNNYF